MHTILLQYIPRRHSAQHVLCINEIFQVLYWNLGILLLLLLSITHKNRIYGPAQRWECVWHSGGYKSLYDDAGWYFKFGRLDIECVRLEYSIFIYTADTLKYWLSAGQHVFDLYIYTIFIWSLSLLPPLRIEEFHHFIWHPAHPWSACHSLLLCEGRARVIHRESIALYRVLHV